MSNPQKYSIEWFRLKGRLGGQAKTERKRQTAAANIAKARAALAAKRQAVKEAQHKPENEQT